MSVRNFTRTFIRVFCESSRCRWIIMKSGGSETKSNPFGFPSSFQIKALNSSQCQQSHVSSLFPMMLPCVLRWGSCSRRTRGAWGNFRRQRSSLSGCVNSNAPGCVASRGRCFLPEPLTWLNLSFTITHSFWWLLTIPRERFLYMCSVNALLTRVSWTGRCWKKKKML